jgi:hypothetical protein
MEQRQHASSSPIHGQIRSHLAAVASLGVVGWRRNRERVRAGRCDVHGAGQNLTVTPLSTISGVNLLNTFVVKDLADLRETVQLGYDEVSRRRIFRLFSLISYFSTVPSLCTRRTFRYG